MRKKRVTIAVIVAAVAVAVLFCTTDPSETIWMPKCFFKLLTGYDCPGCGSSRAFYALLHGHIGEALRFNPILAVALPCVATLIWLQYFGGKERFPRLYNALTGRMATGIILGVIFLYWVGRNIWA